MQIVQHKKKSEAIWIGKVEISAIAESVNAAQNTNSKVSSDRPIFADPLEPACCVLFLKLTPWERSAQRSVSGSQPSASR